MTIYENAGPISGPFGFCGFLFFSIIFWWVILVFFLQYLARMARATGIISEGTKEQRHMMSAGTGFLRLNKTGKHFEK